MKKTNVCSPELSSPGLLESNQKKKNKKTKLFFAAVILLLILCAALLLSYIKEHTGPRLYMECDQAICRGTEFTVDVNLKGIEEEYPAASFSITFDHTKLTFLSAEPGNVTLKNKQTQMDFVPSWSANAKAANQSSAINIMYLDMTGGDNPITKEALKDKNTLFRLKFRAESTCDPGDELLFHFEEATLAAQDESKSAALYKENLKATDAKWNIKE